MAELRQTSVLELRAGDRVGQDIMQGDTVWLRSGTVLQQAQIERIARMGLTRVAVLMEGPQRAPVAPPAFAAVSGDDQPQWMADESFTRAVEPPAALSAAELAFAQRKLELRMGAGLRPLVDPALDSEINKQLQTAYIASATSRRVDLQRLEDIARLLAASVPEDSQDYFIFTDISRYGQHLIARSIMSCKVFIYSRSEVGGGAGSIDEQLKAHLALQNAFALLPTELSQPVEALDSTERERLRGILLQYHSWLQQEGFVSESVLREVLQEFEHYDGSGLPAGVGGEQLQPAGQSWALALAYSERVFSRPKRYRLSPHQAADELVRLSGSVFASAAVNRFLRLMGFFPNGSLVELSDNRHAIVVRQNERGLLKPVVKLTEGDQEEIDLKANPAIFVRRQILEF